MGAGFRFEVAATFTGDGIGCTVEPGFALMLAGGFRREAAVLVASDASKALSAAADSAATAATSEGSIVGDSDRPAKGCAAWALLAPPVLDLPAAA